MDWECGVSMTKGNVQWEAAAGGRPWSAEKLAVGCRAGIGKIIVSSRSRSTFAWRPTWARFPLHGRGGIATGIVVAI